MLFLYLWFNCFGLDFFEAFIFPSDVKFHRVASGFHAYFQFPYMNMSGKLCEEITTDKDKMVICTH